SLAPTTPGWLTAVGAEPMKLGLDLSGGVHFLLQVDTQKVISKFLETQEAEIKKALREARIRYRDVRIENGGITLRFAKEEWRNGADGLIRADFRDFSRELSQ